MFGFIQKLFGGEKHSKDVARSRLHFVLVQDRTGLTNDEMLGFKKEMMAVIERYFVINEKGFDISYKREGDSTTLLINSPVVVKRANSPDRVAANGGVATASAQGADVARNNGNNHQKHKHKGNQPSK